jgi:hypothetical protein
MKAQPVLLLLLCLLLPACASITPLRSKPPYKSISVNRPFSWGDGVLTTQVDMPAGTYTPLYEDDGGYFYQAPQKITGRSGFSPVMLDGGFYLNRNRRSPDKIYLISGNYGVPAKVDMGNRADLTLHP